VQVSLAFDDKNNAINELVPKPFFRKRITDKYKQKLFTEEFFSSDLYRLRYDLGVFFSIKKSKYKPKVMSFYAFIDILKKSRAYELSHPNYKIDVDEVEPPVIAPFSKSVKSSSVLGFYYIKPFVVWYAKIIAEGQKAFFVLPNWLDYNYEIASIVSFGPKKSVESHYGVTGDEYHPPEPSSIIYDFHWAYVVDSITIQYRYKIITYVILERSIKSAIMWIDAHGKPFINTPDGSDDNFITDAREFERRDAIDDGDDSFRDKGKHDNILDLYREFPASKFVGMFFPFISKRTTYKFNRPYELDNKELVSWVRSYVACESVISYTVSNIESFWNLYFRPIHNHIVTRFGNFLFSVNESDILGFDENFWSIDYNPNFHSTFSFTPRKFKVSKTKKKVVVRKSYTSKNTNPMLLAGDKGRQSFREKKQSTKQLQNIKQNPKFRVTNDNSGLSFGIQPEGRRNFTDFRDHKKISKKFDGIYRTSTNNLVNLKPKLIVKKRGLLVKFISDMMRSAFTPSFNLSLPKSNNTSSLYFKQFGIKRFSKQLRKKRAWRNTFFYKINDLASDSKIWQTDAPNVNVIRPELVVRGSRIGYILARSRNFVPNNVKLAKRYRRYMIRLSVDTAFETFKNSGIKI
jgi:hypothetical protein